MKYHFLTKFLAVILAAVCFTGVVLGVVCVIYNANYGFYFSSPTAYLQSEVDRHSNFYALHLAEELAFETTGIPQKYWQEYFGTGHLTLRESPEVDYRITLEHDGNVITEDHTMEGKEYTRNATIWVEQIVGCTKTILDLTPTEPTSATVPEGETVPTEGAEPLYTNGAYPVGRYQDETGDYMIYRYDEHAQITVELFYTEADYQQIIRSAYRNTVTMEWMYNQRYNGIILLAACGIGLVLCVVYLGFAAGRNPRDGSIRPAGLNRVPIDLYTAVDLLLGLGLVYILTEVVLEELLHLSYADKGHIQMLSIIGISACTGLGLVCALYWCALCAQLKSDGFWWKKSLVGRFGGVTWKLICLIWNKFWGLVGLIWQKIWGTAMRLTGKVGSKAPNLLALGKDLYRKLPLVWQWLTIGVGMVLALAFLGSNLRIMGMWIVYFAMVCVFLGLIAYAASAFGELRQAAKRMSTGELDVKIHADVYNGHFRDFAQDLNSLSDACINAAMERMKSERMKTELITNVSHDIKTPLTSIINYVDLLKSAETEQERQEYLEVLSRQSLRLKKLIEDLMEMSKASTGNLAVELSPTDLVESVNQAMGEFADRLQNRDLTVVFRKSGDSIMALCDGKLVWRVMSNLLTNVVKYAHPGTRVYLDLMESEHRVTLSLKNISAEELNVTAEELMERFVRGDESRNTEGNGLGLNIARSLMESQNGTLDLTVDGDLFKVILTLPKAE